ncbi:MAG: hypothetical protein KAT28_04100 [Candidatus Aenigmarchaeota archaeon]|nr:hypothetical protein [Candidatus Aenigmarchaeota archaeon]
MIKDTGTFKIYNKIKNLVIPLSECIPETDSETSNKSNQKYPSSKIKFLFLGGLIVCFALFYASGYINLPTGNIISSEPVVFSEPVVLGKSVYPEKVAHGDVLLEKVFIEDEYGIESVTGEIEGIDNMTFSLIDGTLKNGTWQNAWIVHTTENMKWYTTVITIKNIKGETTVTTLLWQDPTVYHPASQITEGTFDTGDFTFQDNVIVQDNLTVTGNLTVVNGNIKVQGADIIPSGLIVMWSGTYDNIPTGWGLCDGTSGTPNLTDRFIYGVNASYASGNDGDINATGGSSSYNLTVAQLPPHNHTVNDPGHSHTLGAGTSTSTNWLAKRVGAASGSLTTGTSFTGITLGNTGDGAPIDNRPDYYALAFIMKL